LAARAAGKVALVHAIEGGFHFGDEPAKIEKNVERAASLGLGYVTVAHLLYRGVATNAAALPFMSDAAYHALFHEPSIGLEPRGEALVRALVRHGVLLDLTHMSERGMDDTFALLDRIDPARELPVIASHVACRAPNGFEYNLREPYVKRIAERGGVCGVIYCDHFVRDHDGAQTKTFDDSFRFVRAQIDKLRAWGGDDVLAIGSDLDGFIKPTLAGLSSAANHKDLAERLERELGRSLAEKICHGNALRVFQRAWRKPVPGA
ncbi:MAG TPA: membrane dipeptidase, partial [Minicystis sp.]|nr:membrane dipeptidase [Minicystis sp.]